MGLANATYTVTLTDVNACSAAATVTITEPSSSVSASVTVTNVSCYGAANGTATVNATGGTGAFTYAWSNSSNAAEITGLANATYTVTVTDTHGCSANTTVAISQPASALTAGIGSFSNASTGENGSISVAASGGTTPYTYSWSSTGANTSTISGLTAGTYSVTITDAHGCSQSTNVTLTGALLLQASISSITNVACNSQSNGSATVTLSGGVAPYTYNWSNGSTTATINSLVAGTYTVTVNDAVGNAQSLTATISQPETLALTLSATNEICSTGGYNGSIVASVTGGTATYSYEWTPNIAAGNNATSLTIGTYSLSVTDGNGCTTSASVTVYGNNTDINNDGITNVDDFLLFINKYNQTCTGCREDINQDGTVNVTDFLIFIGSYNLVCK